MVRLMIKGINMNNDLDIKTFTECLEMNEEEKLERHLLLGNGFSMSFDPNFSYLALNNSTENPLRDLISKHNNHEIAMSHCHTYENKEKIKITQDDIKKSIVEKILECHPRSVFDIDPRYTNHCYEKFLKNFDKIFTTNFDLLLYNTILHRTYCAHKKNNFIDGFYKKRDGNAPKYIFRDSRKNSKKASVLYLHGALHIFSDMIDLKYKESLFINHADSDQKTMKIEDPTTVFRHRSGDIKGNIKEQLLEIFENRLPIIVMAENHTKKSLEIRSNSYLSTAFVSFQKTNTGRKRSLFIFGHSLADQLDTHISHEIQVSGNIKYIFYGIHVSSFESPEQLEAEKNRIYQLLIQNSLSKDPQYHRTLFFFDSSIMDIWGKKITQQEINIPIS